MNDLSKTQTLKDAKGNNILKIICQCLFEEDNEYSRFKSEFQEVYDAIKITTEDLKKKTENLKKDYNSASNNFAQIVMRDENLSGTIFGKQLGVFLGHPEYKNVNPLQAIERNPTEVVAEA